MAAFQKPITIPGKRDREQHDQNEIEQAEAAGRKRDDGEPQEAGHCQSDADEKHSAGRDPGSTTGLHGDDGERPRAVKRFAAVIRGFTTARPYGQRGCGDKALPRRQGWPRDAGHSPLVCRPRRGRVARRNRLPRPGRGGRVRALFGAISRGTERLVHAGRVPPSEYDRMRAPFMGGQVSVPGEVRLRHRRAGRGRPRRPARPDRLCLHPHQSLSPFRPRRWSRLPQDVPPQRAVLAANMETALNAMWDGAPGPADRIAIVGGGLVGLLVAYLCARLPGTEVTVVDIAPSRAAARAAARRSLCSTERARRPTAISSFTPAQRRQDLPPRCGSPAKKQPSSS